jgi:hypothetical protein
MPWRLVIQPNGLFARFSTVVDDFTDYDMDEAEVLRQAFSEWDCGEKTAREEMDRARREADLRTGDTRPPLSRFRECLDDIREVHGAETAKERERELSEPPKVTFIDANPGDKIRLPDWPTGEYAQVVEKNMTTEEGRVTSGMVRLYGPRPRDYHTHSPQTFDAAGFVRA